MMTDEKMKRFLNPKSAGIIAGLQDIGDYAPEYDDEEKEDDEDEVIYLIEPGSEEEKEGIREARLTLKGMYLSFVLLTLLFLGIGLLLFDGGITYGAGILTGLLTGLFYITHLNSSIKEVLNYDEDNAVRAMKRDAKIRLAVVGIGGVLGAALIGGDAPLGVLAQIFSLKFSAYITPVTAGILMKRDSQK